jgi:hypothetical protein
MKVEEMNDEYKNLIQLAKESRQEAITNEKNAAISGIASSFSSLAGSFIDYASLRSDIANLRVNAGQVELQAKQKANQLREEFIKSMGTYTYSAAKRGVAVSSASVQSNLQNSASALGKDIQRLEQNASLQAGALRAQAKIAKHNAKAQMFSGIVGSIGNIASNSYDLYNLSKKQEA